MGLFLRRHVRYENGKDHIYRSLAESRHRSDCKIVQRQSDLPTEIQAASSARTGGGSPRGNKRHLATAATSARNAPRWSWRLS